jgi:L-lactate dehydrogenase complex protein LldG
VASGKPSNPTSDVARSNILARIRKAQGRSAAAAPHELSAVETYVNARQRGPLPAVTGDLLARFRTQAEALQTTVDEVAQMADVPAATARYLQLNGLPARGCVWPALANLDWAGAGLIFESRGAIDEDAIGITGAFAAIAETGTLMLLSGADTPSSSSLLPETHIAVVSMQRIVTHMEDAWALLRAEHGTLPRAVNFISGPSRTADIEQTIVIGAHGPCRVHIVLVRG